MLVKFWKISYGPKYTKFWAFWQKNGVFKNHFWQSVDATLEDVLVAETRETRALNNIKQIIMKDKTKYAKINTSGWIIFILWLRQQKSYTSRSDTWRHILHIMIEKAVI